MTVFDFSIACPFGHSLATFLWRDLADEYRSPGVRTAAGLSAEARVRPMRPPLSRQFSLPELELFRPVPLPGVRAVDRLRESPPDRDVSRSDRDEALPRRSSRCAGAQHSGRRQRAPRLAHLRGLRRSADRSRAETLCGRILRRGLGSDRLCPRCDDRRSVPRCFPGRNSITARERSSSTR